MWRPQASASKAMRRPRLAARSPSSRRSAAARSMPPSDSGATLLQIIKRSVPSSCMTSNLRSARSMARSRRPGGMPSKSRNGCRVTMSSPSSRAGAAHVRRRAVEGYEVVLEDLDRVELGVGDGFELLAECAAERHRRNRGLHVGLRQGPPCIQSSKKRRVARCGISAGPVLSPRSMVVRPFASNFGHCASPLPLGLPVRAKFVQ